MTAPYLKGNNIHTASCWAATAIGTGNEADPNLREIADRLLEGMRLYKHGRIRKLVLASDGSIIESKDGKGLQGNAADMKQYLADLGMPLEDVISNPRKQHVGNRNVHVRADR